MGLRANSFYFSHTFALIRSLIDGLTDDSITWHAPSFVQSAEEDSLRAKLRVWETYIKIFVLILFCRHCCTAILIQHWTVAQHAESLR